MGAIATLISTFVMSTSNPAYSLVICGCAIFQIVGVENRLAVCDF